MDWDRFRSLYDEMVALAEAEGIPVEAVPDLLLHRAWSVACAAPQTVTVEYAKYLRSAEWRRVRDKALLGATYRCRGCNSASHLEVHHRTYERLGRERPDDLTVLCAACHTAVHLVADGRRGKERATSRRVAS